MQTILDQMNTLPGMVGSLVYGPEGRILAQAFPAAFDASQLAEAVDMLLNGAHGLEVATGPIAMLDFRYRGARIIVRPIKGATLLLLCTPQANLPFLNISLGMAIPKVEKLAAQRALLPEPTPPGKADDSGSPSSSPLEADVEKLKGFEKVFLKMDSWIRKKSGIQDG
ncbi:roadblock/LC7 domain-containing protein [Geothrix sp. PMB-07]|uniref:roadblock/LC7 domain-containing protein n=1 Tax=Geothrix sp. PMB-07 TaxID=3068640 RepID=UPI0027423D45|nr:roadblock/LC7 domain-containing protein [Geothrix sp. PMB-07]WLT32248.1 roadblock/LC7 domain-containing protein [Geothrix sp. PMB-07]